MVIHGLEIKTRKVSLKYALLIEIDAKIHFLGKTFGQPSKLMVDVDKIKINGRIAINQEPSPLLHTKQSQHC